MKFEKITKVRLPFDRRHTDPKKNYGIHGLDIWFVLKGPKGAVQYAATFPVYLPHVKEWLDDNFPRSPFDRRESIIGFDVGYHSPKPMYEDQKPMECEHLEGGKCYYDGSSLMADRWTEVIFSTVGESTDEVLWKMLENYYMEKFGR